MAELANLRIAIDSRDVKSAESDLKSLGSAANNTDAQINKLGNASKSATSGISGMSNAIKEYERDIAALKAKLDPAWAAQQEFNKQQKLGMDAMRAGAITREQFITHMRDISAAQKPAATAMNTVNVAAGAQRAGMQQLSFQLGDVATMYAMGAKPMQIFASQSGQVLQAVQLMTGGTSKLAAFLGGPWGIAIMAGVTVLGALIPKLLASGDAAESASEKYRGMTNSVDGLADAYDRLYKANNRSLQQDAVDFKSAAMLGKLRITGLEAQLRATPKFTERLTVVEDQAVMIRALNPEYDALAKRLKDVREATDEASIAANVADIRMKAMAGSAVGAASALGGGGGRGGGGATGTAGAIRSVREETDALAESLNAALAGLDNIDLRGGQNDWFDQQDTSGNIRLSGIDPAFEAGIKAQMDGLKGFEDILDATTAKVQDAAAAMRDAFGSVGGAIGDMAAIMDKYGSKVAINQSKVASGLMTEAEARKDNARNGIAGMGQLAGAAKGLFKEHSAGYEAMAAAEKAFAVVQMANTAINVAAGAAKMFSALGPFAFPAVAAMVAVMAGLGFSGGGGGSYSPPTAEEMQKAQGTGSILGDSTAKSNSISRALELMAKNSDSELEYSNAMVNSLRAIETNIGSLTSTLARGMGLSGKSSFAGSTTTTGMSGGALGGAMGGMLLGGPIGALAGLVLSQVPIIGDLLNGIAKFVFSKKVTYTLIDNGVKFYAATMADILEGGIKGANYELIQRYRKSSAFGIKISSSTTYSEQLSALDDGVTKQVSLILGNIYDTIVSAATAIGVEGVDDILKAFTIDLGKLSTKDLSEAEIQEAVTAVFSKAADDMANAVLPALAVFQKVGEGMFETLTRLAKDYQTIDVQLMSIGKTFGEVGLASLGARENLIGLFGSLDNFVNMTQFYRANFLTEAQQIAPVLVAVNTELARLGLAGVNSLAGFKSVVDGIDLATESGQYLYAALMALAPGFKAVQDYQDKQAQAAQEAAQTAAKALTDYQDALINTSKTVMDEINRLRGIGAASTSVMLKAQFATLTAQARSGNLDALGKLPALSKSIEEATVKSASSALDIARIRAWLDSSLSQTLAAMGVTPATLNTSGTGLTFDSNNATTASSAAQTADQLTTMSADLYNALYQVAKNTGKSYDLLDRWDGDGLPDIREDASDYY